MAQDDAVAVLVGKLESPLAETRVRALESLIFKFQSGVVPQARLVHDRSLMVALLRWFNWNPSPSGLQVLELFHALSKHQGAAQMLVSLGAVQFFREMSEHMDTSHPWHEKLETLSGILCGVPSLPATVAAKVSKVAVKDQPPQETPSEVDGTGEGAFVFPPLSMGHLELGEMRRWALKLSNTNEAELCKALKEFSGGPLTHWPARLFLQGAGIDVFRALVALMHTTEAFPATTGWTSMTLALECLRILFHRLRVSRRLHMDHALTVVEPSPVVLPSAEGAMEEGAPWRASASGASLFLYQMVHMVFSQGLVVCPRMVSATPKQGRTVAALMHIMNDCVPWLRSDPPLTPGTEAERSRFTGYLQWLHKGWKQVEKKGIGAFVPLTLTARLLALWPRQVHAALTKDNVVWIGKNACDPMVGICRPRLQTELMQISDEIAPDARKLFEQTQRICLGADGATSLPPLQYLQPGVLDDALPMLEWLAYHGPHLGVLEHWMHTISAPWPSHPPLTEETKKQCLGEARRVLLAMLAHPHASVQSAAYGVMTHILSKTTAQLDPERASQEDLLGRALLVRHILHPSVLYQICAHGASSELGVSSPAVEMLAMALAATPPSLLKTYSPFVPLIQVFLTPGALAAEAGLPAQQGESPLENVRGRLVLSMLSVLGEAGCVPQADQVATTVRFLFHRDPVIRRWATALLQHKPTDVMDQVEVQSVAEEVLERNVSPEEMERLVHVLKNEALSMDVRISACNMLQKLATEQRAAAILAEMRLLDTIAQYLVADAADLHIPCIHLAQHMIAANISVQEEASQHLSLLQVLVDKMHDPSMRMRTAASRTMAYVVFSQSVFQATCARSEHAVKGETVMWIDSPTPLGIGLPMHVSSQFQLPVPVASFRAHSSYANIIPCGTLVVERVVRIVQDIRAMGEDVLVTAAMQQVDVVDPVVEYCRQWHAHVVVHRALRDVQKATSHAQMLDALGRLWVLCEDDYDTTRVFQEVEWSQALLRYMTVMPSCRADQHTLCELLHFVARQLEMGRGSPKTRAVVLDIVMDHLIPLLNGPSSKDTSDVRVALLDVMCVLVECDPERGPVASSLVSRTSVMAMIATHCIAMWRVEDEQVREATWGLRLLRLLYAYGQDAMLSVESGAGRALSGRLMRSLGDITAMKGGHYSLLGWQGLAWIVLQSMVSAHALSWREPLVQYSTNCAPSWLCDWIQHMKAGVEEGAAARVAALDLLSAMTRERALASSTGKGAPATSDAALKALQLSLPVVMNAKECYAVRAAGVGVVNNVLLPGGGFGPAQGGEHPAISVLHSKGFFRFLPAALQDETTAPVFIARLMMLLGNMAAVAPEQVAGYLVQGELLPLLVDLLNKTVYWQRYMEWRKQRHEHLEHCKNTARPLAPAVSHTIRPLDEIEKTVWHRISGRGVWEAQGRVCGVLERVILAQPHMREYLAKRCQLVPRLLDCLKDQEQDHPRARASMQISSLRLLHVMLHGSLELTTTYFPKPTEPIGQGGWVLSVLQRLVQSDCSTSVRVEVCRVLPTLLNHHIGSMGEDTTSEDLSATLRPTAPQVASVPTPLKLHPTTTPTSWIDDVWVDQENMVEAMCTGILDLLLQVEAVDPLAPTQPSERDMRRVVVDGLSALVCASRNARHVAVQGRLVDSLVMRLEDAYLLRRADVLEDADPVGDRRRREMLMDDMRLSVQLLRAVWAGSHDAKAAGLRMGFPALAQNIWTLCLHESSTGLLVALARALCNLAAHSPPARRSLTVNVEDGSCIVQQALDTIVADKVEPRVVRASVAVLCAVSLSREARTLMFRANWTATCRDLIKAFHKNKDVKSENALLSFLSTLACTAEGRNSILRTQGLVQLVLDIAEDKRRGRLAAFLVLRQLAHASEHQTHFLSNERVLPLLLKTLSSEHLPLIALAASALCALVESHSAVRGKVADMKALREPASLSTLYRVEKALYHKYAAMFPAITALRRLGRGPEEDAWPHLPIGAPGKGLGAVDEALHGVPIQRNHLHSVNQGWLLMGVEGLAVLLRTLDPDEEQVPQ